MATPMRYSLRLLVIFTALGPPLLAIGWLDQIPLVVGLALIVVARVRQWERSQQNG